MNKGKKVGYGRVSSKGQNLDRQLEELENYGCSEIFKDVASGKNFERDEYQKMKSFIRKDDELVIHELSRFGRNKDQIMSEWKEIIDKGVDITVLNMPILNTAQYKEVEGLGKLVSDIFLTVLSWSVEDDRKRNKKAQREGIEIAKKKGRYKGRPVKYHAEAKKPQDRIIYRTIVDNYLNGDSVMDIHKETGVTRTTIYKIIEQLEVAAK